MTSNIILFMLLFLVSCSGTIVFDELEEAERICASGGGVEFIYVDATSYEVYCLNGLSKKYTKER